MTPTSASTSPMLLPSIQAALGDRPVLTLTDANDANASVSVRLVRVGTVWLGLVDDAAALLERVRVGAVPRFVAANVDGEPSSFQGDATVTLRGRADDVGSFRQGEERVRKSLVDGQPFGIGGAVVIEVAPLSAQPDPDGAENRGALPRT